MQVQMDIHRYTKVYTVDIPGHTQIYSGRYGNETWSNYVGEQIWAQDYSLWVVSRYEYKTIVFSSTLSPPQQASGSLCADGGENLHPGHRHAGCKEHEGDRPQPRVCAHQASIAGNTGEQTSIMLVDFPDQMARIARMFFNNFQ